MIGFRFSEYSPERDERSRFERMLDIFTELVTHTSGDVEEALDWLRELDREHTLFDADYTLEDFVDELYEKGYLRDQDPNAPGEGVLTAKGEQHIRRKALDQIFGNLKRGAAGQHITRQLGNGDEPTENRRAFRFGDKPDQIDFSESFRNAQIRSGINDQHFSITESDLEVVEREYRSITSTVLMIDISHSMILYGEDRITPAKKVAMALSELIMRKYPKDTLDLVVFGNDAWEISIKDLPYLQVGPYHTNTVAGLERAIDILRRRKSANRQIFMITDGKPSCLLENGEYYKNSFGLDPYIVGKCLNLARRCRRLDIPITTFMIASDPYLQQFVEQFTEANNGRAFYTGLNGLADIMFTDFEKNRRKKF